MINHDKALRLINNSVYGNFGRNPDCLTQTQVVINGQLFIKSLKEKLKINDIRSINVNTDGISIKLPRDKPDVCKNIINHSNDINKTNVDYEECK